ncbi:MAG: hypothetical protein QF578_21265 [Alphaproteobacteria bacterium]|jgi:mannose-6-phosphate isomerase-like protein (cupin superfamily)|nr:hypothetical protein [Alphaproteobacteria bacterium]MDP6814664.1 hypothetical protein [Alphaproteobacteria bacterium]
MADRSFDLAESYVHLTDGPEARQLVVDDAFWAEIGNRPELHGGRLVTLHHLDQTWPNWEMHPAGDEIVCLLSGAVDLILQGAEGDEVIALRGRSACIVPRGVWHRAVVHQPGDVLHITRGEGTEHRPV